MNTQWAVHTPERVICEDCRCGATMRTAGPCIAAERELARLQTEAREVLEVLADPTGWERRVKAVTAVGTTQVSFSLEELEALQEILRSAEALEADDYRYAAAYAMRQRVQEAIKTHREKIKKALDVLPRRRRRRGAI